jgi:hypothetical protein
MICYKFTASFSLSNFLKQINKLEQFSIESFEYFFVANNFTKALINYLIGEIIFSIENFLDEFVRTFFFYFKKFREKIEIDWRKCFISVDCSYAFIWMGENWNVTFKKLILNPRKFLFFFGIQKAINKTQINFHLPFINGPKLSFPIFHFGIWLKVR